MDALKPPVLILGTTRSGTSLLLHMLAQAEDTAPWYEPLTVWRTGHAYRDTDVAGAADARPWVRARIRRAFLAHQERHGGRRVVEKTPSNVLRVPFLHAVFPDAKLIHILRDGRANLRSQVEKYESFTAYGVRGPEVRAYFARRLTETPWWEIPAYAPRYAAGLLRRLRGRRGVDWFGVRYEGWRGDRQRLHTDEIAAKQWRVAVETCRRDLEQLPKGSSLEVRYEALVAEPRKVLLDIAAFAGLTFRDPVLRDLTRLVRPEAATRWHEELPADVLGRAMPILEAPLRNLGYLDPPTG